MNNAGASGLALTIEQHLVEQLITQSFLAALQPAYRERAVERIGVETGCFSCSSECGCRPPLPAVQHTEADWDSILGVNLKGPWLLAQAVARQMQAQSPRGGSAAAVPYPPRLHATCATPVHRRTYLAGSGLY